MGICYLYMLVNAFFSTSTELNDSHHIEWDKHYLRYVIVWDDYVSMRYLYRIHLQLGNHFIMTLVHCKVTGELLCNGSQIVSLHCSCWYTIYELGQHKSKYFTMPVHQQSENYIRCCGTFIEIGDITYNFLIRCYRSKWSTISCDNILFWVSIVIYANATQSIYCGQWFHIIQSVPTCIFSTDKFTEI